MLRSITALAAVLVALAACGKSGYSPRAFDGEALLALTKALSSDDLEGRETGGPGAAAARDLIRVRFEAAGLASYGGAYDQSFVWTRFDEIDAAPRSGMNLVGVLEGREPGGPVMVLTAHYDHLGVRDGEIYNGADDNASGVAALAAIAEAFARTPPRHTLVFAALDAEEAGLQGARAFVANPPIDIDRVALNVNLDMVSRSEAGELYASGGYHTPGLRPYLDALAEHAPATLLTGHDRPEDGDQDWTLQSDHAAFHRAGRPFLYFGVEDHDGYHQPSDDFEAITKDFYLRSVDTIIMAVKMFDEDLDQIARFERRVD